MVHIEIVRDEFGSACAYRVTREFPNPGAAAAAMKVLEMINPDAFAPQLEQQIEYAESDGELNCSAGPVGEV